MLAQLTTIVLDCAEPGPLAEFYRAVTGWTITSSDDDSAYLGENGVQLAVEQLLELGATKPEFQPGDGQWTVLADPQGHLLCLAG